MRVALWLLLLFPAFASAHAVPESYTPLPGEVATALPEFVEIRLSERLEPASSGVTITAPGRIVSKESSIVDEYVLRAPLLDAGDGIYRVEWRALSKDDGHFTTGVYSFGIGTTTEVQVASTQVIPLENANERFGMTIELFGHGVLWAVVLLLLFRNRAATHLLTVRRVVRLGMVLASMAILVGGLIQGWSKAAELSLATGETLAVSLSFFFQSQSGVALLIRATVGAFFFVVALVWGVSTRVLDRVGYGILVLPLILFVAARSYISHALSNPFFPELSFFVNMVHLIEKDLWAGALFLFLFALQFKKTRDLAISMLPDLERVLGALFVLIPLSASYIIWLHLKGFANMFTTEWGERALLLVLSASILMGIRAYQLITARYYERIHKKFLTFSYGAEFGVALVVLHLSSVIITTTPPLNSFAPIAAATSEGVRLELRHDQANDQYLKLEFSSEVDAEASVMTDGAATDIALEKLPWGSYRVPSLLVPPGSELQVVARQAEAYDARFDIEVPEKTEGRTFDQFTLFLFMFGIIALVGAGALIHYTGFSGSEALPPRLRSTGLLVAFCILVILHAAIVRIDASDVLLPFKRVCEYNGGLWHLMPATYAGKAGTRESREGCMVSNDYHIVTPAMYAYFASLPTTTVAWKVPNVLRAHDSTTITVRVADSTGRPGVLWKGHERYGHMIAVSKDQRTYIHVHADDNNLSEAAIVSATLPFTMRFPEQGEYILGFDYAQGIRPASDHRVVSVGTRESDSPVIYGTIQEIDELRVKIDAPPLFAGELATIQFEFEKDGAPVTTLEPYLSAAAHVAIVKNDLSLLRHEHAEYHSPNTPLIQPEVRNGVIVHRHALLPAEFGPVIDVHALLPEKGVYTLWLEFKESGTVRHVPFTIRVE